MMKVLAMAAVSFFAFGAEASDCAARAEAAANAKGYMNLTLAYEQKITNGESQVHGYMFWFRQAGEKGNVVVNSDSFCRPFQVYTRYR